MLSSRQTMPYHLHAGLIFPHERVLVRVALRGVGEQSVVDEVGGSVKRLIHLGFGHLRGLGEQAPEEAVHDAGQRGDVDTGAGAGKLLKELEDGGDAGRRPRADFFLFAGEGVIGEDSFLPGSVGS